MKLSNILPAAAGVLLALCASCSLENDMMVSNEMAGFTAFSVENQKSCSINSTLRTVTVTMPDTADLTRLKVRAVVLTERTRALTSIPQMGDVIDLSDTMYVSLMRFRVFDWKLIAVNADPDDPSNQGEQLYNMDFDEWCMIGKAWYPYGSLADDSQKSIWATANKGTSMLSKNTTEPDSVNVAVKGTGKKAARLASQYVGVKFGSGNLFTGTFVGLLGLSGADLAWGVPFTSRPDTLHGYYSYSPVPIDYADNNHKAWLNKMDTCQIQVVLADWTEQFHVINSQGKFLDVNDEAIIGYAKIETGYDTGGYVEFNLPIEYRDERTPKMVTIVAASSKNGDNFTGGDGSVLLLDEFSFKYAK